MQYLITCTFDLKNASQEDYEYAYGTLAAYGLSNILIASDGSAREITTTTTVAGEFSGTDSATLRDEVYGKIWRAFTRKGFVFELFLAVGTGWAWIHHQ